MHRAARATGPVDQAISSFSNLLATIAIAHAADRFEFGAFGVAYALYQATLILARGAIGNVASLQLSKMAPADAHGRLGSAAGATITVAAGLSAPLLLAGILASGRTGHFILLLAVALPALMLQDTLRHLAFAVHRGALAVVNDGTWLGAQCLAFATLYATGYADPLRLFGVWALTSVFGSMAAVLSLRVRPRLDGALRWYQEFGGLIRGLLTEQLFISGTSQGAPLLVGAVAGVAAVGSMRAAQAAFGIVTAVSTGLNLSVVPAAARRWADGDARFDRILKRNGRAMAGTAVLWGIVVIAVPSRLGDKVLGSNWSGAHNLGLVTGLWLASGFWGAPAISALRIVGRQWTSARVRVLYSPLILASCVIGALLDGARGSTLGLAAATLTCSWTLWYLFSGRPMGSLPRDTRT